MPSVAIIGSGIAAASTTYFLNQLFQEDISISIFESASQVGGRNLSMRVENQNIEVGAGIAYSGNKYISNWAKEFNLPKKDISKSLFGLWDGKSFVFREAEGGAILTSFKLVERYGIINLKAFRDEVFKTTKRFDDIYNLQNSGISFETPENLWKYLNLQELTQKSFNEEMKSILPEVSSSDLLINELLYAINKVNYNQTDNINALAGMVSMCPLVTGEVFALKTGWTSIHNAIYKNSKGVKSINLSTPVSRVVSTTISSSSTSSSSSLDANREIKEIKETNPRYKYTLYDKNGNELGKYDAVVMTAPINPIHPVEWKLDEEILDVSPYSTNYQITHATFIKGSLCKEYFLKLKLPYPKIFGIQSPLETLFGNSYHNSDFLPSHIFTVKGANEVEQFSSIAKYLDYEDDKNNHSLFKVFSTEPLELQTLSNIFTSTSSIVATKKWWAYPRFSPPENTSLPFRMKPNHSVYNTSILERSVAAMEISAVSGRNVALLVQKDLMRDQVCLRNIEKKE